MDTSRFHWDFPRTLISNCLYCPVQRTKTSKRINQETKCCLALWGLHCTIWRPCIHWTDSHSGENRFLSPARQRHGCFVLWMVNSSHTNTQHHQGKWMIHWFFLSAEMRRGFPIVVCTFRPPCIALRKDVGRVLKAEPLIVRTEDRFTENATKEICSVSLSCPSGSFVLVLKYLRSIPRWKDRDCNVAAFLPFTGLLFPLEHPIQKREVSTKLFHQCDLPFWLILLEKVPERKLSFNNITSDSAHWFLRVWCLCAQKPKRDVCFSRTHEVCYLISFSCFCTAKSSSWNEFHWLKFSVANAKPGTTTGMHKVCNKKKATRQLYHLKMICLADLQFWFEVKDQVADHVVTSLRSRCMRLTVTLGKCSLFLHKTYFNTQKQWVSSD